MKIQSLLGLHVVDAIPKLEKEIGDTSEAKAKAEEEIAYSFSFGDEASEFHYYASFSKNVVGIRKGVFDLETDLNGTICMLDISWDLQDLLVALYIIKTRFYNN